MSVYGDAAPPRRRRAECRLRGVSVSVCFGLRDPDAPVPHRVRAARARRRPAGMDDHGTRARLPVHRLPVGAARLQPGDGAADRAARQRLRRVRRVGARGRGERARSSAWRCGAPTFRAAAVALLIGGDRALGRCPRAGRRADTQAGSRCASGSCRATSIRREKWDVSRSGAIFEDYLRHDAAGDRARRGAGDLAGVVHAVPVRGRPDGARHGCARWRRRARVPILFGSDQVEWRGAGRRAASTSTSTPRSWSGPTARPAASTARCTSCRSASTCRSRSCCSSRRRSSRRSAPASSPGTEPTLLPVGGHPVSIAICYEVVYPDLVRRFVRGGSELLTTITNDAWFGRDVGAVSAFRAGVDARDRGGPLSGARRQHRHQRHRRSVRPRARAHRHLRAGGRRRRDVGFSPTVDDLRAARRRRSRMRRRLATARRSWWLVDGRSRGVYNTRPCRLSTT